jgi:hypothetical protein
MKKRPLLFLAVVAVACVILWVALSGPKPADDQSAARQSDEKSTVRKDVSGQVDTLEPESAIARESPRHAAGALEIYHQKKDSLDDLNKAVREQEEKVEERRKVLATIVRTKGVIYKGSDELDEQSREEAIKRGLDAQEYEDAKREFETDQQLLQEMKLKQMAESIKAKQSGK